MGFDVNGTLRNLHSWIILTIIMAGLGPCERRRKKKEKLKKCLSNESRSERNLKLTEIEPLGFDAAT